MAVTGTGSIKRDQLAHFVDVSQGIGDLSWEQIGIDVGASSLDSSPEVRSTLDITGKRRKNVMGYDESQELDYVAQRESKLFGILRNIKKQNLTMDDAKINTLHVEIFDSSGDGYAAWTQRAAVGVGAYGGSAADPLGFPFTLHYEGEKTFGTFNPLTKIFTAETP